VADCSQGATCDTTTHRCAFTPTGCDGNNETFPDGSSKACAPFICSGTGCLSNCAGDDQCTSGNVCKGQLCVPSTTGSAGGGGAVSSTDATGSSGAAGGGGSNGGPADIQGGCACRAAGDDDSSSGAGLFVAAIALLAVRRRKGARA
jgi:MYXO-CTERM domain-containing protein